MKKKSKTAGDAEALDHVVEFEEGLFKRSLLDQAENDTNMLVHTTSKKNKKSGSEDKRSVAQKIEKKKLSHKEKKRLEKVVERKNKSLNRNDILEKLASVQVKSDELMLYSSVKNIGQKEKRKPRGEDYDDDLIQTAASTQADKSLRSVNSIAGSKKKRKEDAVSGGDDDESSDLDTDAMSTDSEIDESEIKAALDRFKKSQEEAEQQHEKALKKKYDEYKTNKIEDSDEERELMNSNNDAGGVRATKRKTKYIHVERREEIKESRSKLPIITEEQMVMEKIHDHDIVIVCGETGSGKTTQVPQFLYEAGYAEDGQIIGITEPRRVAAISMSKRVNDEMNFDEKDSIVSYQIRYEGNWSASSTKIKFMTDGVLLKEIQYDFMLSKYSVIIIDEAHERSVYTDILIGLLSRIVPLRSNKGQPLKLIVMSATLRVEDFTENRRLFKHVPPLIKVDSRQYQVSTHFNKHTYEDYMSEAYRKVCKIHRRLPDGGILIFVTGQQEVHTLCSKLKKTFPYDPEKMKQLEDCGGDQQVAKKNDVLVQVEQATSQVNLDKYSAMPLDEELDMLVDQSDDKDDTILNEEDYGDLSSDEDDDQDDPLKATSMITKEDDEAASRVSTSEKPLYILPLYSLLSSEKQARVFDQVPAGCRLCVVATNVAETSLTIPNIKYVVDTGKVKMKFHDKVTGVSTFRICWTSKASADQRTGRAGRTSPGHCYRLYSSAVFNDEFPKFSEPEIKRKPVEDLILQMKDLGIDRIANFPFPTPPDPVAVKAAESLLVQLGALDFDASRTKNLKDEQITKITTLGKAMASFPINPRYSKMLVLASQQLEHQDKLDILSFIICLICGLSVPELFVDGDTTVSLNPDKSSSSSTNNEAAQVLKVKYAQVRQAWLGNVPGSHCMLLGDLMLLLVALGAIEYESHSNNSGGCYKFCEQYGIRYKAITEARKLRKQLVNTVNLIFPHLNLTIDPMMQPPSQQQAKLLRQIVLSGLVDKIAKKYDHKVVDKATGKNVKNAYQSIILEDPIFVHPTSALFKDLPDYVCYVDMVETSRMYMKFVCAIEADWLPVYLSKQCKFEKPIINESEPNYEQQKPCFDKSTGLVLCHRESVFGRVMWPIRAVQVQFPVGLDLYRWFARFLLQGEVVESLKKYESVLLASPTTMLKSWAKLQPRTEKLLSALISQECHSRKKLMDVWSIKKDYLLNEYLMWIPESLHFELSVKWPPIDK